MLNVILALSHLRIYAEQAFKWRIGTSTNCENFYETLLTPLISPHSLHSSLVTGAILYDIRSRGKNINGRRGPCLGAVTCIVDIYYLIYLISNIFYLIYLIYIYYLIYLIYIFYLMPGVCGRQHDHLQAALLPLCQ